MQMVILIFQKSTDNSIDLPAEIFKEVIGQTVIAVSKQESRPINWGALHPRPKSIISCRN